MTTPLVSVVMGVHNSADSLDRTLDSILEQSGVELEFIVVNDGSTDGSGEILERLASSDSRLVVIHQPNSGLTNALRAGCGKAQGRYIARQDAGGDISLPGRLRHQLEILDSRQDAVMVTCGTRCVDSDGRRLYEVIQSDDALGAGLSTLSITGIRGPSHHGSTMFSRSAYEQVGGYRTEYVLAQDIDLWMRLFEVGACLTMPEVLYQSRMSPGSISSRLQERQIAYGTAAIQAARSRREGQSEPLFPLSRSTWSRENQNADPNEVSNMHYFLGSCILSNDRVAARKHFWLALRHKPANLKAWVRVIRSLLPH